VRAAYIEARGAAESIKVGTLPDPEPGPTDVLVEVDAVSVNSVDSFVRSGAYCSSQGGAGHVGRAATVLAHNAGAWVVATASRDDLEECRRLGADAVADYRDPDLADSLHRAPLTGWTCTSTPGVTTTSTSPSVCSPRVGASS